MARLFRRAVDSLDPRSQFFESFMVCEEDCEEHAFCFGGEGSCSGS